MASQQEKEQAEQSTNPHGFTEMVVKQYKKIKENAETYPYVWGSYIVVYGGFALWTTYRWRKLRRTEDRVRALQERLRKLVDSQESASSTTQKFIFSSESLMMCCIVPDGAALRLCAYTSELLILLEI